MTSPLPILPEELSLLDRQPSRSPWDSVVFRGTLALLLFGPLAFGATEPWSMFVIEAGAALLFVLWVFRQTTAGELHVAGNPLFLPMGAFAVLFLLQLAAGLTAYRYQTTSMAMRYVAYGVLAFLVVQSLRKTTQVRTLTIAFSTYGVALALFAVVESISSPGKLYWFRTPTHGGWIYGPYVNHNHYAGLMEMLAPIPLVFSLTRFAHGRHRTLAALAGAVMASTIFLSGSRGGMAAFAVQMAVLGAMLVKRPQRGKAALALGLFLAVAMGLLVWLGGGELSKRLASIQTETRAELSGGMRLDIDRDGLKMFAKKPILGWGLGVFPDVYPRFRSFYTNFFVNQAHNDYLQLLVEMGVFGFATMLWFLVILYRRAIKKLRNWPENTNGAVTLAALLGCTGILVHSFVDFNLQIPANAALFYALCVIAAMEPRFGLSHNKRRRPADSQASV